MGQQPFLGLCKWGAGHLLHPPRCCWCAFGCLFWDKFFCHYDTCTDFPCLSGHSLFSGTTSSNLAFWWFMVFTCLASLVLFINSLHSSKTAWSNTLEIWFIHVPLWHSSISNVLLIVLILSFRSALSAFFIMFKLLSVLMLLLSLILTGIKSLLKHLNKNLL